LYFCILAGSFVLISRAFSLLEEITRHVYIPPLYEFRVLEGLGAAKVIVLGIVGVSFFVLVIATIYGGDTVLGVR
jgi:hypothetical protein